MKVTLRSQGKVNRNAVESEETFDVTRDGQAVGTLTRRTSQVFTGRGNLVKASTWTWVTAAGVACTGTFPKRKWALDSLLAAVK